MVKHHVHASNFDRKPPPDAEGIIVETLITVCKYLLLILLYFGLDMEINKKCIEHLYLRFFYSISIYMLLYDSLDDNFI